MPPVVAVAVPVLMSSAKRWPLPGGPGRAAALRSGGVGTPEWSAIHSLAVCWDAILFDKVLGGALRLGGPTYSGCTNYELVRRGHGDFGIERQNSRRDGAMLEDLQTL